MATLEWQPLAGTLAAALVASGELRDPGWRRAFAEVPRHLFVPRFLDLDDSGERSIDGAAPGATSAVVGTGLFRHDSHHPAAGVRCGRAWRSATHQLVEYAPHHGLDA
jgi:hypothetical protein